MNQPNYIHFFYTQALLAGKIVIDKAGERAPHRSNLIKISQNTRGYLFFHGCRRNWRIKNSKYFVANLNSCHLGTFELKQKFHFFLYYTLVFYNC